MIRRMCGNRKGNVRIVETVVSLLLIYLTLGAAVQADEVALLIFTIVGTFGLKIIQVLFTVQDDVLVS